MQQPSSDYLILQSVIFRYGGRSRARAQEAGWHLGQAGLSDQVWKRVCSAPAVLTSPRCARWSARCSRQRSSSRTSIVYDTSMSVSRAPPSHTYVHYAHRLARTRHTGARARWPVSTRRRRARGNGTAHLTSSIERVRCVWVAAPQRGQSTSSGRLVARLLPLMRATEGRFRAVLESRPRATPQPCAREVIHYHSYLIEIWLFSAVFRYIMGTWTAREVRTGSSAITCCTYGSSEPMSERISAISGRGGSPVSHKQDIFGFECIF